MNTRQLQQLHTFVAELSCPMCQEPFTMTKVHPDPRGVEMPHCCGVYWIPRWKVVNEKLQVHLTFFVPEGMASEKKIVFDNEIQEDHTDGVSGASESQEETQTDPTDSNAERESSDDSSLDSSDALLPVVHENLPVYRHPDLTPAKRIWEYLIGVNAEHAAPTGDIREATGLGKSSFKQGIDTLLEARKVEKIKHGLYRLRT